MLHLYLANRCFVFQVPKKYGLAASWNEDTNHEAK